MAHGLVIGHCDDPSYLSGHHLLRLQGAGGNFRAVDGYRGVVWSISGNSRSGAS